MFIVQVQWRWFVAVEFEFPLQPLTGVIAKQKKAACWEALPRLENEAYASSRVGMARVKVVTFFLGGGGGTKRKKIHPKPLLIPTA